MGPGVSSAEIHQTASFSCAVLFHLLMQESLSDMTETVAKMVVKGGENN